MDRERGQRGVGTPHRLGTWTKQVKIPVHESCPGNHGKLIDSRHGKSCPTLKVKCSCLDFNKTLIYGKDLRAIAATTSVASNIFRT